MNYYLDMMCHIAALCMRVSICPCKEVRLEVVTQIFGFIYTEPKSPVLTGWYVRSDNKIQEMVANKPLEILFSKLSSVNMKLRIRMAKSYAIRNPVLHLAINGTIAAVIYESLNLIVNRATAAPILKP